MGNKEKSGVGWRFVCNLSQCCATKDSEKGVFLLGAQRVNTNNKSFGLNRDDRCFSSQGDFCPLLEGCWNWLTLSA